MRRSINRKSVSFVFCVLVGGLIWSIPPPSGLSVQAIHVLAIFTFTVIGIMLRPFPMGTFAIIGLVLALVTKTLSFSQAFGGFSHPVVWLVVTAFFISRGFIKTGLGERIAYLVIGLLGGSSLGMGYGIVITDLLLAPLIPSMAARVGGILYPIIVSLSKAFQSEPFSHPRKLGAFLMKLTFQASVITSGMFLTAMPGNPMIASAASSNFGINFSWGMWALAASLPGVVCLLIVPFLLYKIYPPELKKIKEAPLLAKSKLKELGPMKASEWVLIAVLSTLIMLWVFGNRIAIEAVVAALIGMSILLLCSVLSWDDVVREKGAWNILVWFSSLMVLADFISKFGVANWFGQFVQGYVQHFSWVIAFIILSLIYFYSHYFFASIIAHVGSMYIPFVAIMIGLGVPAGMAATTLGLVSGLMGGLTHYGCGTAPIIFNSGYVKIGEWWKLGWLVSLVNLSIYLTIGMLWWKFIKLI